MWQVEYMPFGTKGTSALVGVSLHFSILLPLKPVSSSHLGFSLVLGVLKPKFMHPSYLQRQLCRRMLIIAQAVAIILLKKQSFRTLLELV